MVAIAEQHLRGTSRSGVSTARHSARSRIRTPVPSPGFSKAGAGGMPARRTIVQEHNQLPGISNAPIAAASSTAVMPARLRWLLAASCGLIVANIYYAQPLAGPISASLGLGKVRIEI